MMNVLFSFLISINISFIHTAASHFNQSVQQIYQIIIIPTTTIKLTLSHLTYTTITTPPTPPNSPTTTATMSAVYLPSMTFSNPQSAASSCAPSRAGSRAASLAPKSPRRSAAEDYWTSPSANFGFQSAVGTPAASRAGSIKAAKPAGEKKSLKNRVKSVLNKGTEDYWSGAVQNAKFGLVAPPVAARH
jgi:hypothetical protein